MHILYILFFFIVIGDIILVSVIPLWLIIKYISCVIADDYRLFCGDLGNEVNDDVLSKAFSRFPSFNMAKVYFLFTQSI